MDHFLYWSQEKVGPRSVISVTHAFIARTDALTAIATKQIYASHYFTASLGVTLLVDVSSPGSRDTLVVYLNRSRVDMFKGLTSGATRALTRSRARGALERMMRDLKTRLEREFPRAS